MKNFNALPPQINEAVDAIVAGSLAPDASSAEALYARFAVLADVGRRLRSAEREVVDELRSNGATWQMVAAGTGLTAKAAEQRYAPRREAQAKVSAGDGERGFNRAQAATRLRTTADTITRHINANPDAKWFVREQVEGRTNQVIRIVDMDALGELINRGGSKPGPKRKTQFESLDSPSFEEN
jgi:hypothetical protein